MTILEGTIRLQAPEGDPDYIDDITEILGQKLEQLGYSFVPGGWELLGVAVEEGSSGMGLHRPTVSPRIQRSQYGDPGDPYGDPYGNPLTDYQHHNAQLRTEALRASHSALDGAAADRGEPRTSLDRRVHATALAMAQGARKAHYYAANDQIWPDYEGVGEPIQQQFISQFGYPNSDLDRSFGIGDPARDNPCGAGGYGYPPQAVPAPNPVKDDGKWHKLDGGGYQIRNPGPYGSFSNALAYHPRKDPRVAQYASAYELTTGQRIPKGTKWVVMSVVETPGSSNQPQYSAHRTLAAAKRAGSAALSTRSNPWTQAASGPLASSFSPPPDPFLGQQIGSGPIASSYSPPVDPFGRPAFISGTLQGPTAIRAVPGYPLYTGG